MQWKFCSSEEDVVGIRPQFSGCLPHQPIVHRLEPKLQTHLLQREFLNLKLLLEGIPAGITLVWKKLSIAHLCSSFGHPIKNYLHLLHLSLTSLCLPKQSLGFRFDWGLNFDGTGERNINHGCYQVTTRKRGLRLSGMSLCRPRYFLGMHPRCQDAITLCAT